MAAKKKKKRNAVKKPAKPAAAPKATKSDAENASERVPILSHQTEATHEELPNNPSDSLSQFTDQLPFASPTLQLLQQEKFLGIQAHQAQAWEQAEGHFLHAIRLSGETYPTQLPSLFASVAIVYFHMKRYEAAIDNATQAIKHSIQHWPAYLCRSFSYSCLKNLPLAASDYDKAATLLQRSGIPDKKLNRILKRAQDAALDSGSVRQKDKRLEVLADLGELYFTAKTDIYPKDQSIYDEMPMLVPVGEPLEGEAWATGFNVDDLSPADAEEKAMKAKTNGNTAFGNKDWMTALLNYSRAIRLNPDKSVFYSNRACVYLKLERYAETISDCTASIKREPSIKAFARRAAARARLGENQLACEDYLQALEFEPTNQSCLQELVRCLLNIDHDIVKRIEACTSPTDRAQLNKQLRLVRKDITTVGSRLKEPLTRAGTPTQTKKASSPTGSPTQGDLESFRQRIDTCTQELKQDHCNSRAYLERGVAFESLGDFESADKDYRDGLRIDPDNKALQQMVRRLKERLG